jgi:glyoxylase-like metal-dependent hydrolase (beta-lactamase superfamily II)
MCTWAMRCLLIEDGEQLILIDNGIGDKQDDKFFGHFYLHGDDSLDKSLAALGFHRDYITDVVLTHLHFDHCGGSILRKGDGFAPAFKNATYWSNEQHWAWAIKPNDREKASFLKENILPIQESGQLKMLPTQQSVISEQSEQVVQTRIHSGLSMRYVHGHTDAMMLPQININGQTIVFMADLLPSIGHIPVPYVMAYDMFPSTTLNEKKSFLQEAVEQNFVLFFEHDPQHECCNLQMTEKGVRQKDLFRLSEL